MQEGRFVLKSPFKPQGDQPQAIEALAQQSQAEPGCAPDAARRGVRRGGPGVRVDWPVAG